jgi:hypothetical protein
MSTEKPAGAEGFDDRYWRELRERARRRASVQRSLMIGGFMVAIGVLGGILVFVVPADHQGGPAGIGPPLTLVVPGLVGVVGLALMVLAARGLRSDPPGRM